MPADGSMANLVEVALGKANGEVEQKLGRILFGKAVPEDIQDFSASDLAELVEGRLAFITERKPGRGKIAVTNPEGPSPTSPSSTSSTTTCRSWSIRPSASSPRRGYEVRLALHPILSVKRDAHGKLTGLSRRLIRRRADHRESLIHIHVARIGAESDCTALEASSQASSPMCGSRCSTGARCSSACGGDRKPIRQIRRRSRSRSSPNSIAFLQWLLDNHFTFLGMREYRFEGGAPKGELEPVAD